MQGMQVATVLWELEIVRLASYLAKYPQEAEDLTEIRVVVTGLAIR